MRDSKLGRLAITDWHSLHFRAAPNHPVTVIHSHRLNACGTRRDPTHLWLTYAGQRPSNLPPVGASTCAARPLNISTASSSKNCCGRPSPEPHCATPNCGPGWSPSSTGACFWPASSSKTSLAPGKKPQPIGPRFLARPCQTRLADPFASDWYPCPDAQNSRKLAGAYLWL